MSQKQRDYDSTVARVAGNILSGMVSAMGTRLGREHRADAVATSVEMARMIVAEVRRTEPKEVA